MTAVPVIEIDGLVKHYGGLRPMRIARLAVERGERLALSGLDRAGAEVLVNIVNGAILPDEGEVRVFGRSTREIVDRQEWFQALDRFGIVTPRAALLEASTLVQNLALPLTLDLENIQPDVASRIGQVAEEAGLPRDLLERRLSETPQDLRMRVRLGRALATSPEVLLFEHPTLDVSREASVAFGEIVQRAAERRSLTVLAVTEDAAFADVMATTHYRLRGATGALVNARGWRRWITSS